jgi:hypothetical protein
LSLTARSWFIETGILDFERDGLGFGDFKAIIVKPFAFDEASTFFHGRLHKRLIASADVLALASDKSGKAGNLVFYFLAE